jgi:hypothetical protein
MLALRLPLSLATAFLATTAPTTPTPQQDMSFFITSVGSGNGAALGGLEGADKHCSTLAEAAGVRGKTWHAYLSQQALDGKSAVNARDRIGKGPWKNAKGVVVACAAGNGGRGVVEYPAAYPGSFAVAAVGPTGAKAPYSSWRTWTKSIDPLRRMASMTGLRASPTMP